MFDCRRIALPRRRFGGAPVGAALLGVAAPLGIAGGLAACAPPEPAGCTTLFAYGLTVTVLDSAADGPRICDAIVTASEGDFLEPLEAFGPAAECTYVGAGERKGTYRVEAVKDGYATAAQDDVVVTADECHVQGVAVELVLTPIN